jgi:hypothetical protein
MNASNASNASTDLLLVWGRGPAQCDEIRNAQSDPAYLTAPAARALGTEYATRDAETGGYVLHGDAWCVAVPAGAVDTAALDRDPAVVGYQEWDAG